MWSSLLELVNKMQRRSAEQIVDVPIPQLLEGNAEVVRLVPQERVQRIDEYIMDVPVPPKLWRRIWKRSKSYRGSIFDGIYEQTARGVATGGTDLHGKKLEIGATVKTEDTAGCVMSAWKDFREWERFLQCTLVSVCSLQCGL